MIDDRVTRGIILGTLSAVLQDTYGYLAKYFGLMDRNYVDYAKILLFYKNYQGIFGTVIGHLGHIATNILLTVIFAYIIKGTSSKFYLLKGIAFGGFSWYIFKAMATLFRLPLLTSSTPTTEFGFFLGGTLIFGLTISYGLKFFDTRHTL